jgi:hypothetical protein
VVADRYSQVCTPVRVRPTTVADGLAELQLRWPAIPIVFCETRPPGAKDEVATSGILVSRPKAPRPTSYARRVIYELASESGLSYSGVVDLLDRDVEQVLVDGDEVGGQAGPQRSGVRGEAHGARRVHGVCT